MKRILAIALMLTFAFAVLGMAQDVPNPDTIIYMSYGTLNSMDPAYVYDTDSGGLIFQVYENLFRWPTGVVDGNERDLGYSLAEADLIPMLGTVVPTVNNGLVVPLPGGGVQYTVPIRAGVKFHEGGDLTAADVEYTFERGVLQDRRGGPQWMFWEAFSGYQHYGVLTFAQEVLGNPDLSRDDILVMSAEDQTKVYDAMKHFIDVSPDGGSVVFTLGADYPPFLGMLAHGASWGAILDKEWVVEQGGWDGEPGTWGAYYNPGGGTAAEASELYDVANGTGPYKLTLWDPGVERIYAAFDGYWREAPAILNIVHRQVQEWTDRFLAFENMDADIVTVDPQYLSLIHI